MANQPKDFTVGDLSGGFNDSDPPTSLPFNQCTRADNVDFFDSPCGARRAGYGPIDLPEELSSKTYITWLHRHLPTSDEGEAQLWAFGFSDTAALAYRDITGWGNVSFIDTPDLTGDYPFQFNGVTFNSKIFLAYKSAVNRMHVWDGTTLRPTGLLEPAAPTGANSGSGSFATTRYYRTRELVKDGTDILLRSEPSEVLSFNPSGSGAGVTVTKAATVNSNATHWDLEASLNNADFYIIATTVIGTTTATDSTAAGTGYAVSFELSEDVGDYDNIPSGRYLLIDQDRLVIGGNFEDPAKDADVYWTPVANDPGFGNDERIPIDTNNVLTLGTDGGGLTGLGGPLGGSVYVFKRNSIYKLTRTGERTNAYDAQLISRTRGAVAGSVVEAVDEAGRPALYFLDPKVGPCRIGDGGFPDYQVLLQAGMDINKTFKRFIPWQPFAHRALFYPDRNQVDWWLSVDGVHTPNLRINLQLDSSRTTPDGVRLGWTKHDGVSAEAMSACLYSANVNDIAPRSTDLVPFLAVENTILAYNFGDPEGGFWEDFDSTIVSKPYLLSGSINDQFGIRAGGIIAPADPGARVNISLIRDFGLQESDPVEVNFTPVDDEEEVIRFLDNLKMVESRAIQIKLSDVDTGDPEDRPSWAIDRIDLVPGSGQSA